MNYVEITRQEAAEALRDYGYQPIEKGYVFRDDTGCAWVRDVLTGVDFAPEIGHPFITGKSASRQAARVVASYGELADGTPVLDKYPLPPTHELCPEDELIGKDALYLDVRNPNAQWMRDLGDPTKSPSDLPDGGKDIVYARKVSPVAKGHNPDKLTEAQGVQLPCSLLDEGPIRLISVDEQKGAKKPDRSLVEYWDDFTGCWVEPNLANGFYSNSTYRTRKPEGYFLPKTGGRVGQPGQVWEVEGADYVIGPDESCMTVSGLGIYRPQTPISEANGHIFKAESTREYWGDLLNKLGGGLRALQPDPQKEGDQ